MKIPWYTFLGSNRQANDAFFVRSDVLGELPAATVEVECVRSRFRFSVNKEAQFTYLSDEDRFATMADMEVEDVRTGQLRPRWVRLEQIKSNCSCIKAVARVGRLLGPSK